MFILHVHTGSISYLNKIGRKYRMGREPVYLSIYAQVKGYVCTLVSDLST